MGSSKLRWSPFIQLVRQRAKHAELLKRGLLMRWNSPTKSLKSSPNDLLASSRIHLQKQFRDATLAMKHAPNRELGNPIEWSKMVSLLQRIAPFTLDNKMQLYSSSSQAFSCMWKAVDDAQKSIQWVTYICKDDFIGRETIRRLVVAAHRGVRVVFLYDDGGNISGRTALVQELSNCKNARVIKFNPVFHRILRYSLSAGAYFGRSTQPWRLSPLIRNHRKILLVDDKVAYVGGLNIGNEYAGTSIGGTGAFRDTMCRLQGGIVNSLHDVVHDTLNAERNGSFRKLAQKLLMRRKKFLARLSRFRSAARNPLFNFKLRGRNIRKKPVEKRQRPSLLAQVLYSNTWSRTYKIQKAYEFILYRAQHRVWITTPYLLPTRRLLKCILGAARRGVDVRVMTGSLRSTDPWLMWWGAQYIVHRLLSHNISIYEYDTAFSTQTTELTNINTNVSHKESYWIANFFNWLTEYWVQIRNNSPTGVSDSSPTHDLPPHILHSKTVVVDGVWSAVGSYNWDSLSNKLLEVSVATVDYPTARTLEEHFEKDMKHCRQLTQDLYLQRPWWIRLFCYVIYRCGRWTENIWFRSFSHHEVETHLD